MSPSRVVTGLLIVFSVAVVVADATRLRSESQSKLTAWPFGGDKDECDLDVVNKKGGIDEVRTACAACTDRWWCPELRWDAEAKSYVEPEEKTVVEDKQNTCVKKESKCDDRFGMHTAVKKGEESSIADAIKEKITALNAKRADATEEEVSADDGRYSRHVREGKCSTWLSSHEKKSALMKFGGDLLGSGSTEVINEKLKDDLAKKREVCLDCGYAWCVDFEEKDGSVVVNTGLDGEVVAEGDAKKNVCANGAKRCSKDKKNGVQYSKDTDHLTIEQLLKHFAREQKCDEAIGAGIALVGHKMSDVANKVNKLKIDGKKRRDACLNCGQAWCPDLTDNDGKFEVADANGNVVSKADIDAGERLKNTCVKHRKYCGKVNDMRFGVKYNEDNWEMTPEDLIDSVLLSLGKSAGNDESAENAGKGKDKESDDGAKADGKAKDEAADNDGGAKPEPKDAADKDKKIQEQCHKPFTSDNPLDQCRRYINSIAALSGVERKVLIRVPNSGGEGHRCVQQKVHTDDGKVNVQWTFVESGECSEMTNDHPTCDDIEKEATGVADRCEYLSSEHGREVFSVFRCELEHDNMNHDMFDTCSKVAGASAKEKDAAADKEKEESVDSGADAADDGN